MIHAYHAGMAKEKEKVEPQRREEREDFLAVSRQPSAFCGVAVFR